MTGSFTNFKEDLILSFYVFKGNKNLFFDYEREIIRGLQYYAQVMLVGLSFFGGLLPTYYRPLQRL